MKYCSMIFLVLFYYEGEYQVNNSFQEVLRDSFYIDQSWLGMVCDLSQIGDCIIKLGQVGIDIFLVYVFFWCLFDDLEDVVMVKKIEGRELFK